MPTDASLTYADLSLTVSEAGTGRPVLVLHGGGGPATVTGLAQHLSRTAHTITPVHPGWDGTPRPAWLTSVEDLARVYLHTLRERELRDVLVVGSSLGGWIAADMAARDSTGTISGLVLIDAVGVEVDAEPIADIFALDARGVAELSWHDSDRYYLDPADIAGDELARRQANMATMRVLAGDPYMHDPELLPRLGRIQVPTLLLWGESDRVVTPAYGAAYAEAFGDGRLEIVPEAGHLPHIEQPDATYALIEAHLDRTSTRSHPS
ncbi:alpha/beta hydrolase [Streptomyces griseorubiginosus]|uniref:alpha/beta fold hydrolase n=1 Tax=Streptomyces griseorubiginosus TaxID=67304 RepID=UPI002E81DE45|nr:alpha/beta hydrolase [Streptomyces griseorubiginosus]WUB49621.1 alpha/beta hydrolase [Streptomyces griseorubiginosus]WUB58150.1 alpha/beta hydrolase [Streptomyces griseorubiginosus]